MKPCDENIKMALEMVDRMIRLADRGDREREDVGCGILYGVVRDAAYKIRKLAEAEKKAHQKKGWWQDA